MPLKHVKGFRSPEQRMAWLVAIAADAVQIVFLPLFAEGGLSPLDTMVDLVVAVVLSRLIGWHRAFLPALLAELVPGLDLFPTWTAAVFYVTRRQTTTEEGVEVLPPEIPLPPVRRSFGSRIVDQRK